MIKTTIYGNSLEGDGAIIKVAFASKDSEFVNEHFGWARQFFIYEVSERGFRLAEIIKHDEEDEDEEGKIDRRIEGIKEAGILCCQAIGPTAAAKVVRAKIHPIKVNEEKSIKEALEELTKMLAGNPPPWIKKILVQSQGE